MSDIVKGTKVRLKSGGPVMTVVNVGTQAYSDSDGPDHAWTQWFDDKHKLQSGTFPFEAVDLIP